MTLAAAGALGVLAGLAFAWLWLRVVPWVVHRRFWSAMPPLARDILGAEDLGGLLRHYGALASLVGRYVGRNLGGALAAGLPVLAIALAAAQALPGGEVPFFAAFTAAMLAFFLWPMPPRRS